MTPNALLAAARSGDQARLVAIFGPGSEELISSGDAVQDKNAGDAFVKRYGVMRRSRNLGDGTQILLVGADNFPFPIPLKKIPAEPMVLRHSVRGERCLVVELAETNSP